MITTEQDLIEKGRVGKSVGAIGACSHALHARFYNILAYLDHGLNRYKGHVSASNKSILDIWAGHHRARIANAEQERKASASLTPSAKRKNDAKAKALERIKELEGRLERLKGEMGVGMRPIDDVEAEMRTTKTEIAQLKRSWVNRFYFF